MTIPLVSNIIAGLMSQDDKIKLDSLSNNYSSSSILQVHQLSSSYFEFISGNVRTLTGTGIKTNALYASSGSIDRLTASYITGSEYRANTIYCNQLETVGYIIINGPNQAYLGGGFTTDGSNATLAGGDITDVRQIVSDKISSSLATFEDLVVINTNITATIPSNLSVNNLTATNVVTNNLEGNFCKVLSSSFSCSTSGYQYIPIFSHSIEANQLLSIQCLLMLTGSRVGPAGNYSGTIIGVFAPSGSFINGIAIPPNNSLQTRYDFITGSGEIATSVGAINSTILHFWDSRFGIINGNTAGVVYISIRRVSALHTLSVMSGSTFIVMSSKLA